MGAAVAGLAAALVLTGCSSDGDGGGDGGDGGGKDGGSAASSPSEGSGSESGDSTGGSGETGGSDGSGSKGGSLEGTWIATADGKPLALAFAGGTATLLGENVLCSGSVGGGTGARVIELTCPKGDTGRTKGRVESVDGKSMKVAWEGAGTDEFLKTKGGKLPGGLPTAGMPQS
ncbi:hypothetical protein ACFVYR_25290 [Streptomyces sp. NPDC058284]|uniref:hypothetical protein n=1 Tax=unclassified Streptomyces TaxID=2593676 RepID=UPI00365E77D9